MGLGKPLIKPVAALGRSSAEGKSKGSGTFCALSLVRGMTLVKAI